MPFSIAKRFCRINSWCHKHLQGQTSRSGHGFGGHGLWWKEMLYSSTSLVKRWVLISITRFSGIMFCKANCWFLCNRFQPNSSPDLNILDYAVSAILDQSPLTTIALRTLSRNGRCSKISLLRVMQLFEIVLNRL